MHEGLRFCFLALYTVGPAVALLALLRRGSGGSTAQSRVGGWRWYVPPLLLPVGWLLPPALLLVGLGEMQARWLPVRLLGLMLSPGGAAVLVWASASLGRFLVHEAAILQDHACFQISTDGPPTMTSDAFSDLNARARKTVPSLWTLG